MDIVKFKATVIDNMLKITPVDGIEDNSIYEIRLKGIKSTDGQEITRTFKVTTKLAPLYCSIDAVKSLIGNIDIDENLILYNIREASKFADYLKSNIPQDNIPFEVSQFVRYKAAHDCLISLSVTIAQSASISGTVGDVSFSEKETIKDISKLINHLCDELKRWENELQGLQFGINVMRNTVRGSKATSSYPIPVSLKRGFTNGS